MREGTYYSEAESEGKDPDGMKLSQGYLAHVATRAIILIESDDPTIGLVCLMPVGMVEVSSCVIHPEIRPGHRVEKGEEVGYFQYGGSTYCLIFRPAPSQASPPRPCRRPRTRTRLSFCSGRRSQGRTDLSLWRAGVDL